MNLFQSAKNLFGFGKSVDLAAQTTKKKKSLEWENRPTPPYVVDVNKWKRAETLALNTTNPRYHELIMVLDKTMNDAFISSQIENRFNQSLSASFVLKDASGNVDEEQTNLLKNHQLFQFLSQKGLESLLYPNSLVQLNYTDNGLEGSLVPRTNINPVSGIFYSNYYDDKGLSYREQPEYGTWWLEYKGNGLGLLNKAVPHEIMKRFGQSCWAEHTEGFSIPPLV
ncbi:MAG: phage portal protein family protein, partial [Flectobacillus sp.]|uniref:phage portal protein family protein n=1 Tax=Flectobacillus sp. TaxID=50419 RepID=UPI003B993F6F